MPTFVIGEFVFIFAAILLFVHAFRHGRVYIMLWISSLVTGTANDAIFMALPLVDNFWQSQACIMLTPRMPLYIPCVYVVFMYTSTVGAWRFKLPILGQAALSGLMGEMIYAPYDITGISNILGAKIQIFKLKILGNRFVWWTWHDSDAPIRDRFLGAPVGSSAWVITFSCSFQLIWRLLLTNEQVNKGTNLSLSSMIWKIIISALTSTPLMMLQMAFFQLMSGDAQGLPTLRTLISCITVYSFHIYFLAADEKDEKNLLFNKRKVDRSVRIFFTLYFIYMLANMIFGVPEHHMSTGVHQVVGECDVFDTDMTGHKRQVYLCQEDFNEDFNFQCPAFKDFKPKLVFHGTEWYTVCANGFANHTDKVNHIIAIFLLSILGIFTYRVAFTTLKGPKKKSQ